MNKERKKFRKWEGSRGRNSILRGDRRRKDQDSFVYQWNFVFVLQFPNILSVPYFLRIY
jgi:hypothetical protein